MSIDKWIVLIGSTGLIGFIYWFFLGQKEKNSATTTDAQITVSDGYSPSTITVPVGIQTKLTFTRTDTNSCLEELIIPDLKIKKDLPLNTPVTVAITITSSGKYPFHCGMNMYHGQIIAK